MFHPVCLNAEFQCLFASSLLQLRTNREFISFRTLHFHELPLKIERYHHPDPPVSSGHFRKYDPGQGRLARFVWTE
jgi:hypothetical protein